MPAAESQLFGSFYQVDHLNPAAHHCMGPENNDARTKAGIFKQIKRSSCYLTAPMRQMVVPQSGHLPFVIGLPFLVTPSTGSFMVFFALHLTQ
jgi:hypothetical protein